MRTVLGFIIIQTSPNTIYYLIKKIGTFTIFLWRPSVPSFEPEGPTLDWVSHLLRSGFPGWTGRHQLCKTLSPDCREFAEYKFMPSHGLSVMICRSSPSFPSPGDISVLESFTKKDPARTCAASRQRPTKDTGHSAREMRWTAFDRGTTEPQARAAAGAPSATAVYPPASGFKALFPKLA